MKILSFSRPHKKTKTQFRVFKFLKDMADYLRKENRDYLFKSRFHRVDCLYDVDDLVWSSEWRDLGVTGFGGPFCESGECFEKKIWELHG